MWKDRLWHWQAGFTKCNFTNTCNKWIFFINTSMHDFPHLTAEMFFWILYMFKRKNIMYMFKRKRIMYMFKCGKWCMLVFMKKVNCSSKSCSCRCLVVFILIKSSKHYFFGEICRSHVDILCSFIVCLETIEYEAGLKHQKRNEETRSWTQRKVRIYINTSILAAQLKIAQVVTALLVEQCRNNTVIMAEQCCPTNNVVNYCFNNVVQRTMLFTIVSTMLFNEQCCSLLFQRCCSALMKQQRLFTVVEIKRKQYC